MRFAVSLRPELNEGNTIVGARLLSKSGSGAIEAVSSCLEAVNGVRTRRRTGEGVRTELVWHGLIGESLEEEAASPLRLF